MSEALRIILMLAIAGAAITVLGSGIAWWTDVERQLRRYIRRSLKGPPDAVIIAKGRAAAAGFSVTAGEAVVMWRGGAHALLYPLHAFLGAELIVDERVLARVFRGEPRRALDAIERGAQTVTLRLIFDNPRDPDFDLDLWLPPDALRRDAITAAQAIQQGRSWIARVESILRLQTPARSEPQIAETARSQAPPPPQAVPAPSPPPPWEDDDEEDLSLGEERDLFED